VQELCKGKELFELQKGGVLQEKKVQKIIFNLLSAVNYMHE